MDASSFTNGLDLLVVGFFCIFVFLLALMVAPITNLLKQSERTLDATENLIRTLDKELGPTLNEVHTVIGSVQEIKSIAEQKFSDVGTKVEDVSGNITKVAGQAKAETSVWGAGLVAGLKAYLEGKPQIDKKEFSPSNKTTSSRV